MKEPEGSRKPQENLQNQITYAHRGSQTLNYQPENIHGPDLGHTHICNSCVACSSCGISGSRSRCCLTLLPAFGSLLPTWAACLASIRKRCAQAYYNLIHQDGLIIIRGLPFSEERGHRGKKVRGRDREERRGGKF